jgi:predicted MFS family arabinose efflux permease
MTAISKQTPWYFTTTLILLSGCIIALINFGVRSTFGQFTLPISQEFGWPRETFSLAMAIQNLLWGIASIGAGALADRYGAARVLITGAVFYCVGIIMMNYATGPTLMHVGGGVVVGIGIAFSSFGIVMTTLGRMVPPEKRSWAFGIATASGSLGQALLSPLVGASITAFGWHTSLLALAALTLAIIPLALPLWVQNSNGAKPQITDTNLTMRQAISKAFGHGSYILLVAGFFVCGFQLAFITIQLPAYLGEHGLSKEFAGSAMALIGLFNVIGSYLSGMIGGRGEKRLPLSAIYALRAIATMAFITLPVTTTTTLVFTASMGFLWLSTVPLTMGLVTVMFGTRYMATLYGFVFLSHQIGSFMGVWLSGKMHDIYGSYDVVWWMSVGLGVFAAIINLPIRERRAESFVAA